MMDRAKELETLIVISLGLGLLWCILQVEELTLVSLATYIMHVDVLLLVLFGVLLIAVVSVRLTALITKGWMGLAKLMGAVMSRVMLSITFYLVLSPVSFLYRLFNKDALKLKKKNSGDSMFENRDHKYESKDLAKPW